jgi:hypothetical protein
MAYIIYSDHLRPIGLKNLHVKIKSLFRAIEPIKEER